MLEPSNYARVPTKMDSSSLVKRERINRGKFSLPDLYEGDYENETFF